MRDPTPLRPGRTCQQAKKEKGRSHQRHVASFAMVSRPFRGTGDGSIPAPPERSIAAFAKTIYPLYAARSAYSPAPWLGMRAATRLSATPSSVPLHKSRTRTGPLIPTNRSGTESSRASLPVLNSAK